MFVDQFKKSTASIIPVGFLKILPRLGLTANRLTFLALLCTLGATYLFWRGEVVVGGIVALGNWIFDLLDGRVARAMKQEKKLGIFYDFVADRLRLIWLVALAFGSVISWPLALIALLVDALLFLISHFVSGQRLKHPRWLPNNVDLLTAGALINQVVIFVYIKLVLGSILLILQIVSVLVMNRSEKL